VCYTSKALMQSNWTADWGASTELQMTVKLPGLVQSDDCQAIFILHANFNWVPPNLDAADVQYFQSAWFSLLALWPYLRLSLYNAIDLRGVRHQWRVIYTWAQKLDLQSGFSHAALLDRALAHSVALAWHTFQCCDVHLAEQLQSQFSALLSIVHQPGDWVYVHYCSTDHYYMSQYTASGMIPTVLPRSVIHKGLSLLQRTQCNMGMLLFYVSDEVRFVALSGHLNWHYCWQSCAVVSQMIAEQLALQPITSGLRLLPGQYQQVNALQIASQHRPRLSGVWVASNAAR
jgi:hypothetical protein